MFTDRSDSKNTSSDLNDMYKEIKGKIPKPNSIDGMKYFGLFIKRLIWKCITLNSFATPQLDQQIKEYHLKKQLYTDMNDQSDALVLKSVFAYIDNSTGDISDVSSLAQKLFTNDIAKRYIKAYLRDKAHAHSNKNSSNPWEEVEKSILREQRKDRDENIASINAAASRIKTMAPEIHDKLRAVTKATSELDPFYKAYAQLICNAENEQSDNSAAVRVHHQLINLIPTQHQSEINTQCIRANNIKSINSMAHKIQTMASKDASEIHDKLSAVTKATSELDPFYKAYAQLICDAKAQQSDASAAVRVHHQLINLIPTQHQSKINTLCISDTQSENILMMLQAGHKSPKPSTKTMLETRPLSAQKQPPQPKDRTRNTQSSTPTLTQHKNTSRPV